MDCTLDWSSTSFCFRDWGLLYWTSADVCFTFAVTKEDIQDHFKDGPGTIAEVKLMSGFGFIEYEDKADASDVVPGKHQTCFPTIPHLIVAYLQ